MKYFNPDNTKMSFKRLSIHTILLGVVFLTLISGCFEAPNFPNTPQITFDKVVLIQGDPVTQPQDSLKITINYQDGNGDLGIDSELQKTLDFTPIIYYAWPNGDPIRPSDEGLPIDVLGFSEVPPYEEPYICENWEITQEDTDRDTVFFINNINSKNIFVKLLKKESDNTFKEVDATAEPFNNCSTISPLNATFPILKEQPESESPINGSLTYSFLQTSLFNTLKNETLKLEIQIQDRELNKSNIIVTDAFTLAEIRGN